jgi:lipoyl-dependent peroxiredoxin subunit D
MPRFQMRYFFSHKYKGREQKMNTQEMITAFIEKHTESHEGQAIKDLKLNFEKLATSGQLDELEFTLLIISLGKTLDFMDLQILGIEIAKSMDVSHEYINEALQIPAIMGMLNTYYKFRYFVERNENNAATEYGAPGLRMNALAKPVIGKEKFELISLAVSILNSCEKCVIAHEKAVMDLGVPRAKIHDVIRIAAVVKGLSTLFIIQK